MKQKLMVVLCLLIFWVMPLTACIAEKKVSKPLNPTVTVPDQAVATTPAPVFRETCPLPSGYILEDAIATAESTLARCPMKFDEVFNSLLGVASSRPQTQNGIMIHAMLKSLTDKGLVSYVYANEMYGRYFQAEFVSLPEFKPSQLPERLESVKLDLTKELQQKRTGLKTVCALDGEYVKAEKEYARVVQFLENLAFNEEYIRRSNQN